MSKEDERRDISVDQYLLSLGNSREAKDAKRIMEKMRIISGKEPDLYGIGTIGYGKYNYKLANGKLAEAHTMAFYPRANKITVYLMDGTKTYEEELKLLGRVKTTENCIYFKSLTEIDENVLWRILENSYNNLEGSNN